MYLTVEEVEHRGLATLPVRVRAQQDSAGKLATWLTAHPAVRQVYYRPGPGATRIRLTGPAGHHATEKGQNDRYRAVRDRKERHLTTTPDGGSRA